jgi:crotonobetaine/carnitine-CoA ligase
MDGGNDLQTAGEDIPWLLRRWAEAKPSHPGLIWEPADGPAQSWTFAEMHVATRRLAAGLGALGVARGDRVLIHAENSPEMLLAWLATATVGAVAVTTNTRSVPSEVAWFVEHTGCVGAITQAHYASHIAACGDALKWVVTIGAGSARDDADPFAALYGDIDSWPGRPVEPMLPFGIMFTSGTTARPKAVVHTHANAVWASRTGPRTIDLGTDDCYLIYLPLFHVNAQSWSFFSALGVGATTVLMAKWSTSRFWDVVARNRVTHISLMPFVFGALGAPDRPETKLRVGVFGLIMPVIEQMFGLAVYAAYGMTETVTHAISGKPSEHLPERSMGHPSPGYEVAIVDKDTGEVCPEGVTGELWVRGVRGVQLFLEYYANPEATERAFEGDWFKTGDMVVRGEGGNIYYRERDKDLLKVGGENVSAREVEEAITGLPGVAAVAVVGKHHEFLSEVVVAFVIKGPGAENDASLEVTIIETCRERLADFKVPRAVFFVDEFPTGTLDKLLKNQLRVMADAYPAV